MSDTQTVLAAFHGALVEELRRQRPEYLAEPFTVAEIYQNLVPYGTHRDRIGVEMNADYEDALLRLLAGEGNYLILDSAPALRGIREELASSNPNTGMYREYAAVDVRLNPVRVDGPADGSTEVDPADRGHAAGTPAGEASSPEPVSMDALAPSLDLDGASDDDAGVYELDEAVPVASAPSDDGQGEAAASAKADADTCRWCRASLPPRSNLRFCPFCGTDASLVPCGSCGEELEDGWRFCISCGTEVPD